MEAVIINRTKFSVLMQNAQRKISVRNGFSALLGKPLLNTGKGDSFYYISLEKDKENNSGKHYKER